MISLDQSIYEAGGRTRSVRFEVERSRLAKLATLSRSGNGGWSIRRLAIRLGDYVAGLRCLLQSRLASETSTTC